MVIIAQTRNIEFYEKLFEARCVDKAFVPSWNIQPNNLLLTIMSEYPRELFPLNYGMIPFFSKTASLIFYDQPIDGGLEYKPGGTFKKSIIFSKTFRKPLREQRCIIPADYFTLYHKNDAYLFFHDDRSPMAIAGVYDSWSEANNPEHAHHGCCILTTPAYGLFKHYGLSFAPLLIYNRSKRWTSQKAPLSNITEMMLPYPDKLINGYKTDASLFRSGINDKSIAQPISKYFRSRGKDQTFRRKRHF